MSDGEAGSVESRLEVGLCLEPSSIIYFSKDLLHITRDSISIPVVGIL